MKIFFTSHIYILEKSCFELLSIKVRDSEICIHIYPTLNKGAEILKYQKIIKFISCLYSLLNTINKFICDDNPSPAPRYHLCTFKEDNPSLELISNINIKYGTTKSYRNNSFYYRNPWAFVHWGFSPEGFLLVGLLSWTSKLQTMQS